MTETCLGNYRILEKLGQGGMGTVYRAEHQRIPRQVAIKILLPELSTKAALVERFFREARAAATIQHPSVVEIFDCGLQDQQAYIVMALLEGESLARRLARSVASRAPLPIEEILLVGREIALGMAAAHAEDIVHRDLKPDNVFLHRARGAARPQVKILDFGIAKLAPESGAKHTTTGAVLGTPPYMSPEQCRGAGAVDWRTDIYSLGCILFEMACGHPPFLRDGSGEFIVAHLLEVPPSLVSLRPDVPLTLAALVAQLLAKTPEERPQSMEEVARALEALNAVGDARVASSAETGAKSQRTFLPAEQAATAPLREVVSSGAARPTPIIGSPAHTKEMAVGDHGEVSGAPAAIATGGSRAARTPGPRRRRLAWVAGTLVAAAVLTGVIVLVWKPRPAPGWTSDAVAGATAPGSRSSAAPAPAEPVLPPAVPLEKEGAPPLAPRPTGEPAASSARIEATPAAEPSASAPRPPIAPVVRFSQPVGPPRPLRDGSRPRPRGGANAGAAGHSAAGLGATTSRSGLAAGKTTTNPGATTDGGGPATNAGPSATLIAPSSQIGSPRPAAPPAPSQESGAPKPARPRAVPIIRLHKLGTAPPPGDRHGP